MKKNSKKQSKIKKFIKYNINNVLCIIALPLKHLKTLDQRLRLTTEAELCKEESRNMYQLFNDWSLSVVQLGIMCVVLYTALFGWQGIIKSILFILGFGFVPSIISYIKESIKGA